MAKHEKVCPCSRVIEDVADAIQVVADMHPTIYALFERRLDILQKMETQRVALRIPDDNTDHPLVAAMLETQNDLHTLHILVRASGVMAGVPDSADLSWEDADAAFHSPDAAQAFNPIPPKTTKH